jgi:hypothetical protein
LSILHESPWLSSTKPATTWGFGTKIRFEEGLADLEAQYDYEQNKTKPASYQASTTLASPNPEEREQQLVDKRKQKDKTRPLHSSPFITVPKEDRTTGNQMHTTIPRTNLQGEAIHSGYVLHPLCEG